MDNGWSTIVEILFAGILGVVLQEIFEKLYELGEQSRIFRAPKFSQDRASIVFKERIYWIILIVLSVLLSIFLYKKAIDLLAAIATANFLQKAYSTWKREHNRNTIGALLWLLAYWLGILIGLFTEQTIWSSLCVGLSFVIAVFSKWRSDRL